MSLAINSLQQTAPGLNDRIFTAFTNLDKRIIAVVGIAIALIGAIFLLVYHFSCKKESGQVEDKKNLSVKKNESDQKKSETKEKKRKQLSSSKRKI